jgi:predicted nucleic acid-binding protein
LAYSRIRAFPVELIKDIDEQFLLAACRIKAGHSISYADSFAAALAIIKRSPLLTGDPEFKTLDKQGTIAVEWLV